MAFFYRTSILKIESQPIFSDINAASAEVWNECKVLMDLYQYRRGYPHAHHDFWFGKDCEGWIDKQLSKSQPLHSQSIQAVRKLYFKSWISYSVLKKSGGIEKPKPPQLSWFKTRKCSYKEQKESPIFRLERMSSPNLRWN